MWKDWRQVDEWFGNPTFLNPSKLEHFWNAIKAERINLETQSRAIAANPLRSDRPILQNLPKIETVKIAPSQSALTPPISRINNQWHTLSSAILNLNTERVESIIFQFFNNQILLQYTELMISSL